MSSNENLNELLRVAQKMQDNMKSAHEELQKAQYEGIAGSGDIKVTVTKNGRYETLKIDVSDAAFNEGKQIVEELTAAASNAAVKKIETAMKDRMSKMSKDLGVPTDENK